MDAGGDARARDRGASSPFSGRVQLEKLLGWLVRQGAASGDSGGLIRPGQPFESTVCQAGPAELIARDRPPRSGPGSVHLLAAGPASPDTSIAGIPLGAPIPEVVRRLGAPTAVRLVSPDGTLAYTFGQYGITVYARDNAVAAVSTTNSILGTVRWHRHGSARGHGDRRIRKVAGLRAYPARVRPQSFPSKTILPKRNHLEERHISNSL